MTITWDTVEKHIRHSLGGGAPSSDLVAAEIANFAGREMMAMRSWKFAESRATRLNLRGIITIADGTWTAASLTLTKTGAFADYAWLAGDELEITDGTGATLAFYKIASKTDDDSIVLETDPGITDGSTDVDATIELPTVALPDDFSEPMGTDATTSITSSFEWADSQTMATLKTSTTQTTDRHFIGRVLFEGNPPVPILELYPTPKADTSENLTMFYYRDFQDLEGTEDEIVRIPKYVEGLFIDILRARAQGYEKDNLRSWENRMQEIEAGPTYAHAVREDGRKQQKYGNLTRGAAEEAGHMIRDYTSVIAGNP